MRSRFDEQLVQLNVELIKMGSLCELVISNAFHGLIDNNPAMLKLVADVDREIDEKEKEIERMCLKLLLQQQPVARDLRAISAALKMISDLERIGDQASDIAEIAEYIDGQRVQEYQPMKTMANAVTKMVSESIKSYVNKDLALAHKVMADDDFVDEAFDQMKEDIVKMIREGEINAHFTLDLLMIAKYLERIGDHAVNVAEWVEFSITGEHLSDEMREK